MNRAKSAVLLSVLVFPGSGHFLLKSYLKGVLLAGTAGTCLYFLLANVMGIAEDISVKIQSGEIPMETAQIMEAISGQLAAGGTAQIGMPTYILLACWIVSIVDSYLVGRSQQR